MTCAPPPDDPSPGAPHAALAPVSGFEPWILLPAFEGGPALRDAMIACGGYTPRSFSSMQEVLDALALATRVPDLLVTRVRLPDGDAFELIRHLAAYPVAPAIFIVSRQQRSVVKATVSLCEAHGLRMAGTTDMPLDVPAAFHQIEAFRNRARAPQRLQPRSLPLTVSELHNLLNTGRIRAYMQPKMNLKSGHITGFEALMRAVNVEGQVIAPSELIEPLGGAGLLLPATLQMFDQTVDFLMQCLNDGIPVGASVNVPLSLISDNHFCQKIVERVESAGLDPSWITVEITEDEAMANPALAIENTARIRMYGFNLSIDDFGTAYSSFAQLTKIPFSELKIERSFISGIETDKAKRAVVAACALLGKQLGLAVVAEGVETPSELAAVQEADCSHIQGYLLSRPMPVPEASAWLRELDGQRFALAQTVALQSWAPGL